MLHVDALPQCEPAGEVALQERGGLAVGDILTHADGMELTDKESFKAALDRRVAGERMLVKYFRPATDDKEEISEEIWIRLGARK